MLRVRAVTPTISGDTSSSPCTSTMGTRIRRSNTEAATICRVPERVGDERGRMRAIGMAVAVIVPLAIAGVFPHLFLAFAILDATLAMGAWALFGRMA
jgi:hypothetical protein